MLAEIAAITTVAPFRHLITPGVSREAKCQKALLSEGDVVVWGGPSRLNYRGVLPIKAGGSPSVGAYRINLTFHCTGRAEKL